MSKQTRKQNILESQETIQTSCRSQSNTIHVESSDKITDIVFRFNGYCRIQICSQHQTYCPSVDSSESDIAEAL